MPDPSGILRLALDFDGSLVEEHVRPLRWRRGAREFVVAAREAGIHLLVHSCRCILVGYEEMPGDAEEFYRSGRAPEPVLFSWGLHEEMRSFLEAEGVWPLVELWTSPGKPICDVYADDRSEQPDWLVLAAELGVRLTHVGLREPAPLGAPPVSPSAGGGGLGAGPFTSAPSSPAPPASPGDGVGV